MSDENRFGTPWIVDHDGPSRPIILTKNPIGDDNHMLTIDGFSNGRWGSFADEEELTKMVVNAVNTVSSNKPMLPVGVSVLLVNEKEGTVLLGKRASSIPAGDMWSTPGGRIEVNENMYQCALREFKEETGAELVLGNLHVVGFKEHFRYGMHYIMFYIRASVYEGEIKNTQPDKCEGWQWWKFENIVLDHCTEPEDILRQLMV
jgi:8-oxo-dGTP diphosphatase